jgi:hypothetical protein
MADVTVPRADFYVYVIFRLNGIPCYVGKGRGDRWKRHESRKIHDNSHMRSIVAQAKSAGLELPKVKLREDLTEQAAFDLEKIFIAAIGRESAGGPLVNLTDGGDGEGGRIMSDAQKEKLRIAHTGKKHSPEHRAKIGAAFRGRKRSPEAVEKTAAAQRGQKRKPWSDEFRAQYPSFKNPGHTGHKHTDAALEKMRARFKNRPWTEARHLATADKK